MNISEIVGGTITAETRFPTAVGFGISLCLGYTEHFTDNALVRTYTDTSGMVSDGFLITDPLYRMAKAKFNQTPRPESVKIGRLPAAHAHTQTVTITSDVEGEHVKLQVMAPDTDVYTSIDYTILAGATTTTVATAVELLIEAVAGVSASSAAEVITVTPDTAGKVVFLRGAEKCTTKETTADAGYDDALTALALVDNDWYFVELDTNSETNVDLVSTWCADETRRKRFFFQTTDTLELTGAGTLLSDMFATPSARTVAMFGDDPSQYAHCAWVGRAGCRPPGTITWKFKGLSGITSPTLTASHETQLKAVNCNWYTRVAGRGFTTEGYGVDGQYIDVAHGIDWLDARIMERVLFVLLNSEKVPYTDAGVATVTSAILAQLQQAASVGFLVEGSIFVIAAKVADIPAADKGIRKLPDIQFGGTLAGAIHAVRPYQGRLVL